MSVVPATLARMSQRPLVAVEVPMVGDERHKQWAKIVYGVDAAKTSGWAFIGDFIHPGGIQDVPAGAVVLVYGEKGSRVNPQVEARVYVANADATLSHQSSARGRAWARTLRDTVERLLDTDRPVHLDWQPALETFNDDALAEELTRRGWTLAGPREAP